MMSDYIVFWMRNNRRRKLRRYERLYATPDGTIYEDRTVTLQEFMQVARTPENLAILNEVANIPSGLLSLLHEK